MSAVPALAYAHTPISPVAHRLDAARRAVEGRFLQAGEVLAQAVGGLSALIASLDRLAQTLDPKTVSATTAGLEAAAADLMALPAQHAERRGAVLMVAGAGDRLARGIEDMRRTLAYLRVFAINIKITAGGIASAGQEFGDFAQEICDCIEQGRAQLEAFDADLQALREGFRTALVQETTLANQCAGLLPAVPDALVASARAMSAQHQRIAEAAAQVGALARKVQKQMGQALGALQIGDITRQRIEHVGQALAWLDEVPGLTGEQHERMAGFVHRLLAAQLRATAGDFHRDVARIGQAMDGIAGDAAEILRLRDLAFGRSQGGDEGFLRQLEHHVGQALDLVGEMAQADQQALAMGNAAAAAAGDLSARVAGLRLIKTDVQQMALNTTLKCSRIGDVGKPLAVIAVELRTHAGTMEESAMEAMEALEGLSGGASALAGDESVAGLSADVGAALEGVTRQLHEAGDAVESDLASLARQGECVVDGLRRAAARLDFQREIGAILDEAGDALHALGGHADLSDMADALAGYMERVGKSYTMAQERAVHAEFAAELG